jgi:hypothetical protein
LSFAWAEKDADRYRARAAKAVRLKQKTGNKNMTPTKIGVPPLGQVLF